MNCFICVFLEPHDFLCRVYYCPFKFYIPHFSLVILISKDFCRSAFRGNILSWSFITFILLVLWNLGTWAAVFSSVSDEDSAGWVRKDEFMTERLGMALVELNHVTTQVWANVQDVIPCPREKFGGRSGLYGRCVERRTTWTLLAEALSFIYSSVRHGWSQSAYSLGMGSDLDLVC